MKTNGLVVNVVKWLVQSMVLIQAVSFVTGYETYNSVYIALVVLFTLKAYNYLDNIIVKWVSK